MTSFPLLVVLALGAPVHLGELELRLNAETAPLPATKNVYSGRLIDTHTDLGVEGRWIRLTLDGRVVGTDQTDREGSYRVEFEADLSSQRHVVEARAYGSEQLLSASRPAELLATSNAIHTDPSSLLSLSYRGSCTVRPEATVMCWGDDASDPDAIRPALVEATGIGIAKSLDSICVIERSGSLACGDGGYVRHSQLTKGTDDAVQASISLFNGCVIRADSTLGCWGHHSHVGRPLDDGAPDQVPIGQVPGLEGITDVFTSPDSAADTCATSVAGELWCWGSNSSGALGFGHRDRVPFPATVQHPSPVVDFTVDGGGYSCSVHADGIVRCRGSSEWGQIGIITSGGVPRLDDVQIELPEPAVMVSGGAEHACAVLASRRVACWGRNDGGNLGDGTRHDSLEPVWVIGLDDVLLLDSGGGGHTCALVADGGIWCWGWNWLGQLGVGDRIERLAPSLVLPARHRLALSASGGGAIAVEPPLRWCGSSIEGSCLSWGDEGVPLTLEATPRPGWRFAGWRGACSGVTQCAIEVSGPIRVRAHFESLTPVEVPTGQ